MKNERVLMLFKFISMVFLILFLLLNIACISYYENKFTFILLFILFILFFIPGIILYKNLINLYLIKDYKQVEEKSSDGKIYRFSKINSTIINDYQIAIIILLFITILTIKQKEQLQLQLIMIIMMVVM